MLQGAGRWYKSVTSFVATTVVSLTHCSKLYADATGLESTRVCATSNISWRTEFAFAQRSVVATHPTSHLFLEVIINCTLVCSIFLAWFLCWFNTWSGNTKYTKPVSSNDIKPSVLAGYDDTDANCSHSCACKGPNKWVCRSTSCAEGEACLPVGSTYQCIQPVFVALFLFCF